MPAPKKAKLPAPELRPRIRIMQGRNIAFGPGKADLLSALAETGSLNQAARRMGMSYMRAWLLVQEMNRSYAKPLVKAERGGSHGGGASLTITGQKVLTLYREMEQASLEAMGERWEGMQKLLAKTE